MRAADGFTFAPGAGAMHYAFERVHSVSPPWISPALRAPAVRRRMNLLQALALGNAEEAGYPTKRIPYRRPKRTQNSRLAGAEHFLLYLLCLASLDRAEAAAARSSQSAGSPEQYGGAGESRTPDTQFRKLLLYPSELQPRLSIFLPPKLAHASGRFTRRYAAVTISLRNSLVTYKLERATHGC